MKGKFIVFEGLDGCGKTTQAMLLMDFLERIIPKEIVFTREPGNTHAGDRIRDILLSPESQINDQTEVLCYLAARSENVEKNIIPNLEAGKIVISDRFDDSSIAYQGYGKGIDIDFLKKINKWSKFGIEPDLTFYLMIDPELGIARQAEARGLDRMESNNLEFFKRANHGYYECAKQCSNPHVIDATRDKLEIHEEVKQKVLQILPSFQKRI